jgi:two-component system OmpR family sensor kinase
MRRKRLRDWTLRARLIAGLLGLLVTLCLAIGVFTGIALRHSLMGKLDDQLTAAVSRVSRAFEGIPPSNQPSNPPRVSGNSRGLLPPGSQIGTIGGRIVDVGTSAASIQTESANGIPLASNIVAQLAAIPRDAGPHTVNLSALGSYRAVARTMPDGGVLVSGLPMKTVNDTLMDMSLVVTGLTGLGLLIAGVAGTFIVRLALRPLHRVTATATRVADMPLDEGEVALAVRVPAPNPHTEVGQVGVALNRMLENVSDALNARHRSETRVRQFVADASHELRTPLASIRGYAELTRRSRDAVPPDIAHAMSRVESEARRMTSLVEDLLLLARLDAGRPLDNAEVDLTRLIVDVMSDAHIAGPEHHWHLDLPDESVSVSGDDERLHQVLANVLANARTHTPPGTNVRASLSQQGQTVLIEICDDGPGIAPDLIPDIFERFSRGEASRFRGAGSTGLGLAIVAAVVSAHNGQIQVVSRPGRTAFTVRLPMHGKRQADPQIVASLTVKAL